MRIRTEAQGPPLEEPITVAQLEALVRLAPVGAEPSVWPGFISAARQQVEHDTERVLISTPYLVTVVYDDEPWYTPEVPPLRMAPIPIVSRVQAVRTALVRTRFGTSYPLSTLAYRHEAGTVAMHAAPRTIDRIEFEMDLGWPDAATLAVIAPSLVQAVGILAVHYVTSGRDLVAMGLAPAEIPFTYRDAIQAWRVESVA
jgi:uncharacterized phiE125 gp8 family phage protein